MQRVAIDAYIDLCLDRLTNRGLMRIAEKLLTDDSAPEWAQQIASIHPDQVLAAKGMLVGNLLKQRILPDSRPLRECIRDRVLKITDGIIALDDKVLGPTVREIELHLKLLPNYEFNALSMPIVEYPYSPSNVTSAAELADYIRQHVDEIVGLR